MLGELKFSFPNKHAVYMHDTNARHLFEEASRAVQPRLHARARPAALAEMLLAEDKGWDAAQVADLIANGPPNNEVPIDRKIPVHITYFTAWVDEHGELQTARDVYGHEKRITQALQASGRRSPRGRTISPRCARRRRVYSGGFGSVGDFISQALGGF